MTKKSHFIKTICCIALSLLLLASSSIKAEAAPLKKEDFKRVSEDLKKQNLITKIPDFNDFHQPPAGK